MCQIERGRVVGGGSLRSESNHGCDHYLFNAEADFFIPTLDRAPYLDNVGFLAERDIFYFLCKIIATVFFGPCQPALNSYLTPGTLSTHA